MALQKERRIEGDSHVQTNHFQNKMLIHGRQRHSLPHLPKVHDKPFCLYPVNTERKKWRGGTKPMVCQTFCKRLLERVDTIIIILKREWKLNAQASSSCSLCRNPTGLAPAHLAKTSKRFRNSHLWEMTPWPIGMSRTIQGLLQEWAADCQALCRRARRRSWVNFIQCNYSVLLIRQKKPFLFRDVQASWTCHSTKLPKSLSKWRKKEAVAAIVPIL